MELKKLNDSLKDLKGSLLWKNLMNGKSDFFTRPVLILKRFNKNIFFGIPLSTQIKDGNFFFTFNLNDEKSNALLVQGKTFDVKRLEKKIGMISKDEFSELKIKLKELLAIWFFPSGYTKGRPEGN